MPLASPRYEFQPPILHGAPPDPGIYALYRGSELVCIGVAAATGVNDTLYGCLLAHWESKQPAGITHYQWEISRQPARARERYLRLLGRPLSDCKGAGL
jgi:hypothetical protein